GDGGGGGGGRDALAPGDSSATVDGGSLIGDAARGDATTDGAAGGDGATGGDATLGDGATGGDATLGDGATGDAAADGASDAPPHVFAAATDVYWPDQSTPDASVRARTLPAGPSRVVVTNVDIPSGVAVAGATVYYAQQNEDGVRAALPDGGSVAVSAANFD